MKKVLSIFSLIPILMACSSSKPFQLYEANYFAFHALTNIKLYDGNKAHLADLRNLLETYDRLCSSNTEIANVNNVYAINNAKGPIVVEDELFELLDKTLEYQEKTNGYFNPLMGDLSDLWKKSLQNKAIPSETDINNKLNAVKNSQLVLDKNNKTVEIIGDAKLDLGAVAKGYVLQLMVDYLKENNVAHYLINGGDSSIGLGKKPDYIDFNVGLKDLPGSYFTGHDIFVSTSSAFVQGVTIDNQLYSHIVNPFTGSAITNFDLVILKGNADSGLMDALSTAISCMEKDEAIAMAKEYQVDLLLYKDKNIVYTSEGMEVKHH